ncbi:MAG TPA: NAD+ synthase [Gammaproteobacteria bacterium]|nr:NAD+ synthase [Gammaproteobacteria bacterium]
MRVALAQLNTRVGAIDANTKKVLECAARARDELHCDLVLFPELTLCGYPPEDLLLHRGLRSRVEAAFATVKDGVRGVAVYLGYPEYDGGAIYNSAALIRDGVVLANHRKIALPNYAVFDEKRYFTPGEDATVVDLDGIKLGLIICEDVWVPGPCRAPAQAGAQAILVINGSPFHMSQQRVREQVLAARAKENSLPLLYVNMVGGQDELVFDGGSIVVDSAGEVRVRAPLFEEGLYVVELDAERGRLEPVAAAPPAPTPPLAERVYGALVLGTRDYVDKNGFAGTVLGLSGGVDSALTLSIAVDALGADRVHAVMMPSRYTSQMSKDDAAEQAKRLGVRFDTLPIEPLFETTLATLRDVFVGLAPDTTEENIQARCRGILLMAISNKLGEMLLSTGNKSEMAVGYATLYGDMAGGFAPLKDCTKTLVYQLASYRNSIAPVIPERVIARPPTAELRDNQKDSDSLPPYDVLDPILEAFIEKDYSVEQITALGFDRATVVRVLQMVKRAEYKRRQAPPGVRVSNRAFGRDWRYPITSGY